jgi:hypothetical protein
MADEKPRLDPDVAASLHKELAEELLRRLRAGRCAECDRSACTVPELTAIRQFLSDNGVTEYARANAPIRKLLDAAPFPKVDPTIETLGQLKRDAG